MSHTRRIRCAAVWNIIKSGDPYRATNCLLEANDSSEKARFRDVQTVSLPTGNLFLDNLPAAAFQSLAVFLRPVQLRRDEVIYHRDELISTVLFPVNGMLSVITQMSDGNTAEVGLIGREGMSGVPVSLGVLRTQTTLVQIPNGAFSLSAAEFGAALEQSPALRAFSMRYAHATMMTALQISGCNSLHVLNERCARWLLMAHDRVDDDMILLTQEFLAQMLAVRRSGVTVAASAMQEAGFISYSRGHITIRNRAGLEAASCECYETMLRDWESIMGYPIRKASLSKFHPPEGYTAGPEAIDGATQ